MALQVKTVSFPGNETLASFGYRIYDSGDIIIKNNGAPCALILQQASDGSHFQIAGHLVDELKQSWDDVVKTRTEMSDHEWDTLNKKRHFDSKIDHVLSGNEHLYIDGIAPKDIQTVAAKALRFLHAQKVISRDELDKAYQELNLPKASLQFIKDENKAEVGGWARR